MATKSNPLEWMSADEKNAFDARRFDVEYAMSPSIVQQQRDELDDQQSMRDAATAEVDIMSALLDFDQHAKPIVNRAANLAQQDDADTLATTNVSELTKAAQRERSARTDPFKTTAQLLAESGPAQLAGGAIGTAAEWLGSNAVTNALRDTFFPGQQGAPDLPITDPRLRQLMESQGLNPDTGQQVAVPGAPTAEGGPTAPPTVPGEPHRPFYGALQALAWPITQIEAAAGKGASRQFKPGAATGLTDPLGAAIRRAVPDAPSINVPMVGRAGGLAQQFGALTRPGDPVRLAEIRELTADLPEEIVRRLNETIGFSFAGDPESQIAAFRDTREVIDELQAWQLSRFGDLIVHEHGDITADEIQRETSMRFASRIQDITDKYGNATAEILGNIFLDPLNLVGFGLLGKIPIAGKLLGPLERGLIRATEDMMLVAGKGITRVVGTPHGVKIAKQADQVQKEAESFFTRTGQLFTDDPEVVNSLLEQAQRGVIPSDLPELAKAFADDGAKVLPDLLGGHGTATVTPKEAVDIISNHRRVTAEALIEQGAEGSSDKLLQQMGLVGDLMRLFKMPKGLADRRNAAFSTVYDNVLDPLHRNIQIPHARAVLQFVALPPWNYVESLIIGINSGASPGMVASKVYDAFRVIDANMPIISGRSAVGGFQTALLAAKGGKWTGTQWLQSIWERLDDIFDGGIRRNAVMKWLKQEVHGDSVLRSAYDQLHAEIVASVPPRLRAVAQSIADDGALFGLHTPGALPQIADMYAVKDVGEKAVNNIARKYSDFGPMQAVMNTVTAYTEGKIRSIGELRKRVHQAVDQHSLLEAHAKYDILDGYIESVGELLKRETLTAAERTDLINTYRFLTIHVPQAHKRLQALIHGQMGVAKRSKNWTEVRRLTLKLDAEQLSINELQKKLENLRPHFDDPAWADDLTVSKQFFDEWDRITNKYERIHQQEVQPLQQAATDAPYGGGRRARAWDRADDARVKNWGAKDKEMEALFKEHFPDSVVRGPRTTNIRGPRGEVIERAPVPDDAPSRLDVDRPDAWRPEAVTDYFDSVRQPLIEQADRMVDEIADTRVLTATPEDVKQLREALESIAGHATQEHGDRMRQAVTTATRKYASNFIQYPGNSLDAVMRYIDPFWIYQSRKLGRITQQAVRHPGQVRLYEDYFANSERGYLTHDGQRYQVDFTRGSGLSLMAANRRRHNTINPDAPFTGEAIVSGDRFQERHEGFFGHVEQAQEIGSALGYHVGFLIESGLSLTRAFGLQKDREANFFGPRREQEASFFQSAELGGLLPPPVEGLLNIGEIAGSELALRQQGAGADSDPRAFRYNRLLEQQGRLGGEGGSGLQGVRDVFSDPFHERAVRNIMADQLMQYRSGQRDRPPNRDEAVGQAARDEGVGSQSGMTRVRSAEYLQYLQLRDQVMASHRGLTAREMTALRQSGEYEPPDPYENMLIDEALARHINGTYRDGRELRMAFGWANVPLRPRKLREASINIRRKDLELDSLLQRWRPMFDAAVTQLGDVGFITNAKGELTTLSDIYKNYWRDIGKIEETYADLIPQTTEEWQRVADLYGAEPPSHTEFALAYQEYRAIKPDNEEFDLKQGDIDWDAYFTARENKLASFTPATRKKIEAMTSRRILESELPFRAALKQAAELRRGYYDVPKFFYLQGDDTGGLRLRFFSDQDQALLERLEKTLDSQIGASYTAEGQQAFREAGHEISKESYAIQRMAKQAETGGLAAIGIPDRATFDRLMGFNRDLGDEGESLWRQWKQSASLLERMGELTPRQQYDRDMNAQVKFPGVGPNGPGLMEVVYDGVAIPSDLLPGIQAAVSAAAAERMTPLTDADAFIRDLEGRVPTTYEGRRSLSAREGVLPQIPLPPELQFPSGAQDAPGPPGLGL